MQERESEIHRLQSQLLARKSKFSTPRSQSGLRFPRRETNVWLWSQGGEISLMRNEDLMMVQEIPFFFLCVCVPLSYRSQSQIIVSKRTLSTVKFCLVSTSIWKYRTDTVWMEEYGIVQQAEIENHTGTALVEAKWMEYSLVMHYWESVPSKKGKAWVFVCEFMGMDIIKVTVHV